MEEKSSFFFVPAVVTYGKSEKTAILTQNFRRKSLEMSAADKIAGMYTFHRAHVMASSAAGTLLVIDGGKVVFNLNCSLGAGFFAFSATDTAVGADLAHLSALIMARALNNNTGGVVYKADNSVGTFLYTETAADTFSGVDLSYAFFGIDADSVSRANLNAVTVAKAGKGTIAVSRIRHICRKAGLCSVINVLSLAGKAGAVAGNVSNTLYNLACFKSHDLCDLLCNSVASGDTEAGIIGRAV